MGLFSFIGDIFGSGGGNSSETTTSVTSTPKQETNVTSNVEVLVDLEKVGEALEYMTDEQQLTLRYMVGVEEKRQVIDATSLAADLKLKAGIISEYLTVKNFLIFSVIVFIIIKYGKQVKVPNVKI
jgi:hypothetical protein